MMEVWSSAKVYGTIYAPTGVVDVGEITVNPQEGSYTGR